MEAPRSATPHLKESMVLVSDLPVRRRLLPSPYLRRERGLGFGAHGEMHIKWLAVEVLGYVCSQVDVLDVVLAELLASLLDDFIATWRERDIIQSDSRMILVYRLSTVQK
jgi:hypothetical protein